MTNIILKSILISTPLLLFFVVSPYVDEHVAALAYNPITHKFYGETSFWCSFIYHMVPLLTLTIVLVPIVVLILSRKNRLVFLQARKFMLIMYLILWIGPGIIVNNILKDHWGRPRPYQVLRDHAKYTPFWQPNFEHKQDNSFPSGHASVGFFLGVPFIILGRKKIGILVSLVAGVGIGVVRILQGGHYVSDVLWAGLIVYLVSVLILFISSRISKKGLCEI